MLVLLAPALSTWFTQEPCAASAKESFPRPSPVRSKLGRRSSRSQDLPVIAFYRKEDTLPLDQFISWLSCEEDWGYFPVYHHPRNSQTSVLCLHLLSAQLCAILKQPSIKQTNKKAIVRHRRVHIPYQTAWQAGINLFLEAACHLPPSLSASMHNQTRCGEIDSADNCGESYLQGCWEQQRAQQTRLLWRRLLLSLHLWRATSMWFCWIWVFLVFFFSFKVPGFWGFLFLKKQALLFLCKGASSVQSCFPPCPVSSERSLLS